MLRQKNLPYFIAATVVFAISLPAAPSFAIETLVRGASPAVGSRPAVPVQQLEGPLTVMQVQVDKTSANAVAARDEAIAEARRIAFQKLAERNMTPEEFKSFKTPDDRTIGMLVQDFEITGEQLAANRYVANFTVRFRDRVRNYIPVDMNRLPDDVAMANNMTLAQQQAAAVVDPQVPAPGGTETTTETVQTTADGVTTATTTTTVTTTGALQEKPRKMLVLPYFEGMDGKTVLWEENNPWRDIWQKDAPRAPVAGNQYVVPLGDISDVSAGSPNAVWSGDYRTVEKLRQNYGADDVVLAVANRSGPYLTLDMYFFRNGKLQGREVLQPYVGEADEASILRKGMNEVMAFMQRPVSAARAAREDAVAGISRTLVPAREGEAVAVVPNLQAAAPQLQPQKHFTTPGAGATAVSASLSFTQMTTWMDFQRRVAGMTPPVAVDISSLSKNNARFTLRYNGGVAALQSALAARGVMMSAGGGADVYSIQLVN